MFEKYNKIIRGSSSKDILIDVTFNKRIFSNKIIIFSHGFKGFKDWGPFNKVAEYFAVNGFIFVKFNFSFNGTSTNNPSSFVDLDAFGYNNFCKELDDLALVINWVKDEFSCNSITLFGHSRGGAISIIKSAEDSCISNVISWASPSNLLSKLPIYSKVKIWKETNVAYVYNGRTKQNMPLFYQFYENCLANSDRLSIEKSIKKIKIPHLHIHGDADPTVLIDEAYNIKSWNRKVYLHVIKGANHVFNASHPYNASVFPADLTEALNTTLDSLEAKRSR
jgi:pimeloyl-ACP methyl ester carboxylesterase